MSRFPNLLVEPAPSHCLSLSQAKLRPFYGTKEDDKTRNGPVVNEGPKEHSRKAMPINMERSSSCHVFLDQSIEVINLGNTSNKCSD